MYSSTFFCFLIESFFYDFMYHIRKSSNCRKEGYLHLNQLEMWSKSVSVSVKKEGGGNLFTLCLLIACCRRLMRSIKVFIVSVR